MAETNTIVEQLPSIKKINSEKNVEWAMGEYSGGDLFWIRESVKASRRKGCLRCILK